MSKITYVLIFVLLTVFTFTYINPVMAEDFFELVIDGSLEEVQKAVDTGADINARTKDGKTPLMYAAYGNKNPKVIKVLLDASADINARDKDESTPLMYAASNNKNPEIIKALLEAGADVNARDKNGWTSLIIASGNNENLEIIEILLDAGADVNVRTEDGWTSLMYAQERNENPEVIEVLLEAGAGINARDKDGGTYVMYDEEQNKNNAISKEEKNNISSGEIVDEENILEKIKIIAKKYNSDLQGNSKVINIKEYIKMIDITGYTKTYDSKSYVVDVFINTEENFYKDVLEMSYEMYNLIYENRKNHNINHVSLIYRYNSGTNSAQVTLGINVIKNIFSKKIDSANEFYDIINSNKNFNAEYLEDVCVANEYGYISE